MRKRIYEVIEVSNVKDKLGNIYDAVMIVVIVMSLVPLAFKEMTPALRTLDLTAAVIFIIDYILRWMTADYKFNDSSAVSFVKYPFTVMAIIDLLSILPSISMLNSGFKVLRVVRMMRAMRVVRILKAFRYSTSLRIVEKALSKSKDSLIAVAGLAIGYMLISALVIFNVEPDTFSTFYDAVYWSAISLTTVGYGDICPATEIGRLITMVSSILGIAVVALPSGIITASLLDVIKSDD